METTMPRPAATPLDKSLNNYSKFRRLINKASEDAKLDAETNYVVGSYRSFTQLRGLSDAKVDVTVTFRQFVKPISAKEHFRVLADKLCEVHPTICTNASMFGGVPHIKNVRLSVGDILAKLYVYGNIQKIVEIYSPHVSEEQVKEAIAYAQDFLEMACDPDESSEVDG